jgi:hypothetical protein
MQGLAYDGSIRLLLEGTVTACINEHQRVELHQKILSNMLVVVVGNIGIEAEWSEWLSGVTRPTPSVQVR